MRRALIVMVTAASVAAGVLSSPAQAGGRGGAVAAGVVGGLAVGAILGAAAAQPRHYGPPPAYVVERAPVYVSPPPEDCYWTRGEPVWDGYRGVWRRPRVQVCD